MISIITPVWNLATLTAQYLYDHSIHYHPSPVDIEWIVVNNGSTDGTGGLLEYWKDTYQLPLRIIKNTENLGFSKANNQGAKEAKGNILVFLNNDISVKGDYIFAIEKAIANNPRSLVGPQLLDFDTGWNVFDGRPISYLVGWCLAMTKEVFDDLGGFDERYTPAYYEDIDLCYNAYKAGYALQVIRLPLRHIGGQTGHQLKGRRQITEANREKFAQKWGLSYETE
jgi:GT2 family glycosyltransferase